jgi:hypothetical protein
VRRLRRSPDDVVVVRIGFHETHLRERARALGGIWRPAARAWELQWSAVRKLGIADRVEGSKAQAAGAAIYK